jgi:hypothetical protein
MYFDRKYDDESECTNDYLRTHEVKNNIGRKKKEERKTGVTHQNIFMGII